MDPRGCNKRETRTERTPEDEGEDDDEVTFDLKPTKQRGGGKRRKTILVASTLEEEDDEDSDDEVTFAEPAVANELTDAELAHKYKVLYESACMKLIYSEDRIQQLEAELPKARSTEQNPVLRSITSEQLCSVVRSGPPPVVFDDSTEAELKKMKARLRHVIDTPSKRNKRNKHKTPQTDTRSALMNSLAFRRVCVAAETPEGSPCADEGAFGTPPSPDDALPSPPCPMSGVRTMKRLTELF
jgi:hypothetical protein